MIMATSKKKTQAYNFERQSNWPEGLYQRGNVYWVRWTLSDGSQIQQSLKTKNITEAKNELILIKSGALQASPNTLHLLRLLSIRQV